MKFRPLHDRMLVRRIEEDEKTVGAIIIPETAKKKPMQCEVPAVGPGETALARLEVSDLSGAVMRHATSLSPIA